MQTRFFSCAALFLTGAALFSACGSEGAPASLRDDAPDAGVSPDTDAPAHDAAGPEAGAQPEIEAPVACGTPLPGAPLTPGVVEAPRGYAEALAAVDLSSLPDPFDFTGETEFVRGVIRFMLGTTSGTTISHAEALDAGGLGRAVLAAAARGQGGELDFAFLRQGLYYHYPCSRPLPNDLAELKSLYGDYVTWPTRRIDCSRPKDGPRTLYENRDLGIYVAETVVDTSVRETEVLFANLREDGQLDFAVYTPEGELTDRSTFSTGGGGEVTSAAPYACMTCHVDVTTETYSLVTPGRVGAGCL
jgi:hypothetical protein